MEWFIIDPRCTREMLGHIPGFLAEDDPRPAYEQFEDRYRHGGGWRPFEGFTLAEDLTLHYPGDPPFKPLAFTTLRQEVIFIYQHAWVLIFQLDSKTWEVARMD